VTARQATLFARNECVFSPCRQQIRKHEGHTRGERLVASRRHSVTMVACPTCKTPTRASEPECDWCDSPLPEAS
jgi:hypothetical protein